MNYRTRGITFDQRKFLSTESWKAEGWGPLRIQKTEASASVRPEPPTAGHHCWITDPVLMQVPESGVKSPPSPNPLTSSLPVSGTSEVSNMLAASLV